MDSLRSCTFFSGLRQITSSFPPSIKNVFTSFITWGLISPASAVHVLWNQNESNLQPQPLYVSGYISNGFVVFLHWLCFANVNFTAIYWILGCTALLGAYARWGRMPYLAMLVKVKLNSGIRSGIERLRSWPVLHPAVSRFYGNRLAGFAQTDKQPTPKT